MLILQTKVWKNIHLYINNVHEILRNCGGHQIISHIYLEIYDTIFKAVNY